VTTASSTFFFFFFFFSFNFNVDVEVEPFKGLDTGAVKDMGA
jgi:hypothetical protein